MPDTRLHFEDQANCSIRPVQFLLPHLPALSGLLFIAGDIIVDPPRREITR